MAYKDDFTMSLDSLEHGWACLSLEEGVHRGTYMFSHVGADALSGIVDTAIRLSGGVDSVVHFNMEPEEVTYLIKAQADGTFLLMIEGSSFRGSTRRYIRQVLKMFEQYGLAHDGSEYISHWHHAYPSEKLELLRRPLHSA